MSTNIKFHTGLLGLLLLAVRSQANDLDISTDLINSPVNEASVLEVPMGASTDPWIKGKGKGGDPVWTGADPGQVYVNPGQNLPQPGQNLPQPGQNLPQPGQFDPGQQPFDPGQRGTGLIFADPQNRPHQPETAPSAPHTYHDHQASSWYQPAQRYQNYYYNNNTGSQGSWTWNGYGWTFQYSYNWNTQPRRDTWSNYNSYNWSGRYYDQWRRQHFAQLDRRTDRVRAAIKRLSDRSPRGSYYRNYYQAARQQGEQLYRNARRGDTYSEQQLTWWLSSWESYLGIGNYYYGQTYAYQY